jgi:hypothetical protein
VDLVAEVMAEVGMAAAGMVAGAADMAAEAVDTAVEAMGVSRGPQKLAAIISAI